ncbi:MAG: metallophosphoesterase family protein [Clostridia bacterium]|nr:metallophosphoesterase family protein [Clostridia bacterium]
MRYLVLSDIHGNNVALKKVLDTVSPARYDRILVLGDNIGDGPCPDKVLDELISRDAIMIAGNREELANDHFGGFHETQTALQWKFMRDSINHLSSDQRKFIKELNNQRTVNDGGLSVRMVHGSPDSIRELLYYNHHQRLNECLDSIDESILLCGHNHYQFAYLSPTDKLVLNPGSVGLSQKGEAFRADYALLNIFKNQFSFELNHVYYDGESIKKEYIDRGLWDSSIWGQLAFREMSEGKTYIVGFARHVYNLAKSKNAPTHPLDDKIWLEACETWNWVPAQ